MCHQEHLKANAATDFRSAGKFLFLSHLPTTLHIISAYRTPTPHQQGRPKGKTILGTEVEGSWELRGDVFQLPQLRGRADVPDPVARHPPERGTNPAMRCHTWSDNKPQQFSHKYGSTCVSFVFIRPKRQDLRSFCSSRPGNKAPAQRGVSLLNF